MASDKIRKIIVFALVTLALQFTLVEHSVLCEETAASHQVLRRFIAWKFKDGTSPEKINEIISAFKDLKNEIPNVISIESGTSNSPEQYNKGLTHGFIITFPNESARNAYLIHPSHVKFKEMVLPWLVDGFGLDFLPEPSSSSALGEPVPAGGSTLDLTHVLAPGLPNFHEGDEGFQYHSVYTVEKDGYASGKFCTAEHYGTHIDAPSHFFDGKASIEQLPAERLVRPCVVIDVRDEVNNDADYQLTVEKIQKFEIGGKIPEASIVLLLTGWSKRWSDSSAYRNADKQGIMHFPAFSAEAANFLTTQRHVVGLGTDTLSADRGISHTYDVHKIVLGQGLFLIENLDKLENVPARGATLVCAPLPIKAGTGSPARILAVVSP